MRSLAEAEAAKRRLLAQVGRPSWLRGLGIGFADDGGYRLEVKVDDLSGAVRDAIPTELEGVEVHVSAVGRITPRGSTA